MERIKLFKLGICSALMLSAVQVFAAPPKTWDAIFNAEGQGDYAAAKIDGDIRFGQYTPITRMSNRFRSAFWMTSLIFLLQVT